MEYTDVERALQGCFVEPSDDDVVRAEKRARRQQAERDLESLLDVREPDAEQAHRLATILSYASPSDSPTLERARDLAQLAHAGGQPGAGLLFARCVDRLLYVEHRPQRYGTIRPTLAGQMRMPELDPTVTDAERVALGLLPAVQVREEIERANRKAASDVALHGLADGVHVRAVLRPMTEAQVLEVLAGRSEAVWRDGSDLVFCWRGEASAVTVWFGTQMAMDHLAGTDVWVLAVRIRDVDRAVLSYRFLPDGDATSGRWGEPAGMWRGPLAPPEPLRAPRLAGEVRHVELASRALGEPRTLHVYRPPGHDNRHPAPVLYATDGRVSAELIEPLIIAGRIPPILSVGIPFGADIDGDRRAQEYLPGFQPERFDAHRRFFVEEVPAWAEKELGASDERRARAVFGVSNGAAFAAAMGVRHPELFGNVIAFSLGVTGAPPDWKPGAAPRHYLCAGAIEEGFARTTQHWADVVGAAGAETVHCTWVSGHDPCMWDGALPSALEWAFGPVAS